MNVSNLLGLIGLILLSSCGTDLFTTQNIDEEPINTLAYEGVDERLFELFQLFEHEAAQRGIDIDLRASETTGEISHIQENGVAGTCEYSGHFNHVTIDLNYWNNTSDMSREFVVFHELGHCVLHRDHEDSSFNNGVCMSIMASGLGDCRNAYNSQNREYYIDELFHETN